MSLAEARGAIGIWGLGREGRAAAQFLASRQPARPLTLLTDDPTERRPEWAGAAGFLSGTPALEAIGRGDFALLVKSPGVSLYREEIAAAREKGTRVSSGTNLWFEAFAPRNVIAVTGTKGKSTTSAMLHALLQGEGHRAQLLGNGGTPALSQPPVDGWNVLELSSYQIADLDHAPLLALFTNLYREHVPWHGSCEAYFADKLRLARDPATLVVANSNDAHLSERLAGRGNVNWYGDQGRFTVRDEALLCDEDPVTIGGAIPPGAHNLLNLAGALTALDALDLLANPRNVSLAEFAPLPHRLERFDLPGGVIGVNDSISTIPESAQRAIETYAGYRQHLILGGTDRAQDYAALARFLRSQDIAAAWLLPETGQRIATELADAGCGFPVTMCETLEAAVAGIARLCRPGDVVMLSPAAPSYGQFANFEERGARFRQLCETNFKGPQ